MTDNTAKDDADQLGELLAGTSLDTPTARRLRARTPARTAARTRLFVYFDEQGLEAFLRGAGRATAAEAARQDELVQAAADVETADIPALVAVLETLREHGAAHIAGALAARTAAHLEVADAAAVGVVLELIAGLGQHEPVAELARRAADHAAVTDPRPAADLIATMVRVGARGQAQALAARAAVHADLAAPEPVARLLRTLRRLDVPAAAVLERDPAAHAAVTEPGAVAALITALYDTGAPVSAARLALRAAAHTKPADLPGFARLIRAMVHIHAPQQVIDQAAATALEGGLIDLDQIAERLSRPGRRFALPAGEPARQRELVLDLILAGLGAGPRTGRVGAEAQLLARWLVRELTAAPGRRGPTGAVAALRRYLTTILAAGTARTATGSAAGPAGPETGPRQSFTRRHAAWERAAGELNDVVDRLAALLDTDRTPATALDLAGAHRLDAAAARAAAEEFEAGVEQALRARATAPRTEPGGREQPAAAPAGRTGAARALLTAPQPGTTLALATRTSAIEIAAGLDGTVAVRNAQDPHGPELRFDAAEWAAFTTAVKNGALDPPRHLPEPGDLQR